MKTKKKQNFENSLKDLEKIVSQLEDGDLSLEESLKLFEEGVKLSRECQERLNQAERRIEVLLKDSDGNPTLGAMNTDDSEFENSRVKRRIVFNDNDEEEYDDDETPF